MSATKARHVVILGCGRSGTSIFGELFEHLSPYTYYSEPPFDELLRFDFSRPVAVKVPKKSEAFPPPPGLSFPLEALFETVPNPQVYWQVRHPLDTVCSLRVGIAQDWGHHPKPPDWRAWLKRPLLERCAHHWAYLNTVGYRQVAHLAKVKRFEEMIHDPLQLSRSVAEEVGLDTSVYNKELTEWAKRVQDTNNEDFVEAETSKPYSRPDHTVRVGRWRENLTDKEVRSVLPIIREAARTFSYSLPD